MKLKEFLKEVKKTIKHHEIMEFLLIIAFVTSMLSERTGGEHVILVAALTIVSYSRYIVLKLEKNERRVVILYSELKNSQEGSK